MCGIHFILSNNQQHTSRIDKMVASSTHRGPDNQCIFKSRLNDNHLALGHNLLAIVGDKNDTQPLFDSNYGFAINGEIYNYIELANKYNITNRKTDSIVAYQLLQKMGVNITQEFNGMFAFIFIDFKNKQTYLVRDFFGQKPLFYSNTSCFIASSENKSILSTGLISSTIAPDEVRNILTQKHIDTGSSIYQNIQQVLPGEIVTLSDNGNISKERFQPLVNKSSNDLKSTIQKSTFHHCLETNHPAVFYSGGLDSSILLHELKQSNKNPIAYTIDTNTSSHLSTSDTHFARVFAKSLSVQHKVVSPSLSDFDDFISTVDVPIGDGAFYFNWLLAKEVSKNHKTALTGAGADELFGGYNRHLAYQKYKSNKSLFLVLSKFRSLTKIINTSNKGRLINKFLSSISTNEKQTFLNFIKLNLGLMHTTADNHKFLLERALDYDLSNYLPQDILSLGDQAGMSQGLEIRSPFLDVNIWDVAQKLNPSDKIKSNGKHHLKTIYKNNSLFETIINRKKEGFGIPFSSFFGQKKMAELTNDSKVLSEFLSKHELSVIQKIIKEDQEIYSNEYWTLHILTKWLSRQA